jgi:hypothetical protein
VLNDPPNQAPVKPIRKKKSKENNLARKWSISTKMEENVDCDGITIKVKLKRIFVW